MVIKALQIGDSHQKLNFSNRNSQFVVLEWPYLKKLKFQNRFYKSYYNHEQIILGKSQKLSKSSKTCFLHLEVEIECGRYFLYRASRFRTRKTQKRGFWADFWHPPLTKKDDECRFFAVFTILSFSPKNQYTQGSIGFLL